MTRIKTAMTKTLVVLLWCALLLGLASNTGAQAKALGVNGNSKEKDSASGTNKASSNPFVEIVGPKLYKWGKDTSNRDTIVELDTSELLKNKDVVAIYYSAHWCGPCRNFTPLLAKFYNDMQKKGKKFEIIWASSDQSDDDFLTYYLEMPWVAVPLNSELLTQVATYAAKNFNLKGIPHLVILDGVDASVYTTEGREKVSADPYGLQFPYRPRSVINLVPRGIKNFVSGHVRAVKQRVRGGIATVVGGVLAVPGRVVGFALSVPGRLIRLPWTLLKMLFR
jgi:thiol-disulfide isomerase/thioredoxin